MNRGRPLRFLALTIGGWTAARVVLLWPATDPTPTLIRAIAPPSVAAPGPQAPAVTAAAAPAIAPVAVEPIARLRSAAVERTSPPPPVPVATATAARPIETAPIDRTARSVQPPPLRPAPLARPPGRLAGSVWGILRGGLRDTVAGTQLGGSQAGARITYALGDARRVALAARVSTPLHGRGAEMGLGVDWQPTTFPLHVIAEQRIAIAGRGGGGPTLMVVGGLDPRRIALGFRLEAYGQAGAIARHSVEGFADAAARVVRPVARVGTLRLDLGAGAWGGVQVNAARIDVGPSLAVTLPVERRSLRITLDWRQRIAGRARPGSGPALSIGGDF